jgi:hypothetical protein
MRDFLGAVARRAMGEPLGLRPLATPWIPLPDERRVAEADRPVPAPAPRPSERLDPTPDPGATAPRHQSQRQAGPTKAASETPARRRTGWTRPIGVLEDQRPAEAGTEGPIPVATPTAEPPRSVPASPGPAQGPARPRTPSMRDASLAESTVDAPAPSRTLAPPRRTGLLTPEGALRPTALLDRSFEARQRRDPAPPDDDGPVVHVSIGRIEVRAVQPPSARPATRPMAPGLSLDAYLRRRDEGAHR